MDVAIIGAGLAGLACAHELERYDIKPTIYERNSYIGEQFSHVGALLELVDRPIVDSINYIKKEFNIEIMPLNIMNRLISYSPNRTYEVKGKLGYFTKRNKEPDDLKKQLYAQLNNTEVKFNEAGDYETLKEQYDFVVVANGAPSFAKELGCFNELFNGFVRGAVVLGEFDPHALLVWLDKDYCKNGYAYLAPFNAKKAFLGLVIPDVNESDADSYWELFKNAENLKYPVVEEFKINHISGFVYPHKVSNILFAGNAGGSMEPFLGFGVFNSIVMGVMAGKSIVTGLDYEDLLKDIVNKNKQKYQLRKLVNMATNKGYDNAFTVVSQPGIRQLIYNTSIDVVKHGANIVKFLTKNK
ncbi:MAG TPA: dehydrogenase [Clostridiales bacterium]|nr:MAG: dehydrogenase [Clostridiales bacterium GWD2_32_59]HAN10317.1 dehydrogenase [Clostridiales bacterium]